MTNEQSYIWMDKISILVINRANLRDYSTETLPKTIPGLKERRKVILNSYCSTSDQLKITILESGGDRGII